MIQMHADFEKTLHGSFSSLCFSQGFSKNIISMIMSANIYLARHTMDLGILVQEMHEEVVQTKLKHEPCTYYNGEPGHAE